MCPRHPRRRWRQWQLWRITLIHSAVNKTTPITYFMQRIILLSLMSSRPTDKRLDTLFPIFLAADPDFLHPIWQNLLGDWKVYGGGEISPGNMPRCDLSMGRGIFDHTAPKFCDRSIWNSNFRNTSGIPSGDAKIMVKIGLRPISSLSPHWFSLRFYRAMHYSAKHSLANK